MKKLILTFSLVAFLGACTYPTPPVQVNKWEPDSEVVYLSVLTKGRVDAFLVSLEQEMQNTESDFVKVDVHCLRGSDVAASRGAVRVLELKEKYKKKVLTYINDGAGYEGYWFAVVADKLFTNNGSQIGAGADCSDFDDQYHNRSSDFPLMVGFYNDFEEGYNEDEAYYDILSMYPEGSFAKDFASWRGKVKNKLATRFSDMSKEEFLRIRKKFLEHYLTAKEALDKEFVDGIMSREEFHDM